MSFLFPFALFGLLAIPALIIIYILRNKYKEETAPSTYIWEMAAKLLKRKNPLSRFEHLLALIVQCLAIAVFSIALAHPVFTLEGQADDIVFILDSSSSMGMVHEEKTRFEKGIELIKEKVDGAVNGSTFTLILAEKEPRLVCQNIDDVSRFEMYLDNLGTPSKNATKIADSVALAQNLFSEGKANLCYLATDQNCGESVLTNIEWLDCSDDEENYSISDLSYKFNEAKTSISFSLALTSYASDKDLNVTFYYNGQSIGKKIFHCDKGVTLGFVTDNLPTGGYPIESVKAVIEETDGLMDDNTFTVYANTQQVNTKALIVSSAPTYLKAIFDALKIQYDVMSPASYSLRPNYDIYVYDSYKPNKLPEIGATMFFGLKNSVEGSGFLVSNEVIPDESTTLAWTNNEDSNLYKTLTRGIGMNRDILLKQYMQYSLVNNFTTVLTANKRPAVFVGRSDFETREVVFNFDLHNSNLPLLYDFVPLMRNLVDYCKPKLLTKFDYEVGDSVVVNIADEISQILVERPNGEKEPLTFAKGQEQYLYETRFIGEHTLHVTYQDGNTKIVNFFAHMSKPETVPQPMAQAKFTLALTDNTKKGDGILDNILPIIIAAAAFFAADWILYTHEQY
ncbi:MAG: BatA and WFA domain-containing protein [Bacilli bacterium]|nr:BatA and WFA domain-containing protein [Bacilli bacterium]